MRKIRDVLRPRLRHANGLSQRAIAQSLGVSKGSIDNYLRRAEVAGLGWPLPDDLSDEALCDKLSRRRPLRRRAGDRSRTDQRSTRSYASRA